MASLIDLIATSLEPAMRVAYYQAVEAATRYVTLTEIENALRRRDYDYIYTVLERAVAERFLPELKPFYDILTQAATRAGTAPILGLGPLQFRLTEARVATWVNQHVGLLIVGVVSQTKQAVRRIVYRGYTEGFAPKAQARMIRDVIGLDSRQEIAYSNYREALAKLTDIPEERRQHDIALYNHRLKTQRANRIARHETFRATMAGRYLQWEQQVQQGILQADRTWVKWIVVDDDRLCVYCRPLDGKRVPIGEGFLPTHKGGVEPVYRTRKPDPYSQKRDLLGRFAKAADEVELTDKDLTRLRDQWDVDQRVDGKLRYPPLHIQCRCELVLEFDL